LIHDSVECKCKALFENLQLRLCFVFWLFIVDCVAYRLIQIPKAVRNGKSKSLGSTSDLFPKGLVYCKLGVLGTFVELQEILALLCKAAGEEVGKESLNGTKDKDVTNR